MFDTIGSKHILQRAPSEGELRERGFNTIYNSYTREPRCMVLNGSAHTHLPGITISQSKNYLWHLRAEASISGWLNGSNIQLPGNDEVETFMSKLSAYVFERTGIPFDARTAKVVRLDITKDFQVGMENVISAIGAISQNKLNKYRKILYDDVNLEFRNKGKRKTKKINFYSKMHRVIYEKLDDESKALAMGILRLEVSYTSNDSIDRLQKQYDLPSKDSSLFLTKSVSDGVINKTIQEFNAGGILAQRDTADHLTLLLQEFSPTRAFTLLGFINSLSIYGKDFYKIEDLGVKKRTYHRYQSDCRKAGIIA